MTFEFKSLFLVVNSYRNSDNKNRYLKLLFILFVAISLSSCGKAELDDGRNWAGNGGRGMQAPTKEQLNLSLDTIPQSLFQYDVTANNVASNKASKPGVATTRNKIRGMQTTTGQNVNSNWDFDPFSANAEFNRTESACGLPPDYEPSDGMTGSSLHNFGTGSFCLITVAKLAVMRAVGNYANFGQMLPEIAASLAEANNPQGTLLTYRNSNVSSVGADGLKIDVYYDECVNQRDELLADAQAFAMCTGELDSSVYHRVKIFPQTPKNGTTVDTAIGKMEWLFHADGSTAGQMVISRNLMSDTALVGFAPPQIQFDFNSDQNAEFKSFTMKFAPQLPPGGSVSRELFWDANVIHVTRVPASGTNPAIWTVQGNILFTLNLGTNPLFTGGFTFEPFAHRATPRVYFSAVAEDIFVDGNAVYKAIMADGPGLNLADYPQSDWTKEFHLWSAYKKMLAVNYTQEHYENSHGYGDPQLMYVFDEATAQRSKILEMGSHSNTISAIDINSTGTVAVTASADGTIGVWDIDRASPTFEQQLYVFPAPHGGATVDSISFSPVDDNLILSGGHDGYARVFSLTTKQEEIAFFQAVSNTSFRVKSVWSNDGNRIATASNQGSKVWNAVSGALIANLGDFGQGVRSIAFHPTNNDVLITGETANFAKLWNVNSSTLPILVFTDPDASAVNGVSFSPNGVQIATVNNNGYLYIWDSADNVAPVKNEVLYSGGGKRSGTRVKYSADGNSIFVQAWGSVIKFDAATLTYKETYVGYASAYDTNGLSSFAVMPDDTTVLIGHNGAFYSPSSPVNIGAYNLDSGLNTPDYYLLDRGTVREANYAPDGASLVSAHSSGHVELWDARKGGPIRSLAGHTNEVLSARYNSDSSKIVTASGDGTARVWDVNTGAQLLSVSHPGNPPLVAASFSPDGSTIVTASGRVGGFVGDGTVLGWDAVTGNPARTTSSLRNENYHWVASTVGVNQYYLSSAVGDDPFISDPNDLNINSVAATRGTVGSLVTGEWAYGDVDTLGYTTVYIYLDVDPETLATDAITSEHAMNFNTAASAAIYANDVFYSPLENNRLAIATDKGSQWWSTVNTVSPVCVFDGTNDVSIEVSSDGQRIVVASVAAGGHLWSVDSSDPTTFCTKLGVIAQGAIAHAKFSPIDGGKNVITHSTASGYGSNVYLWDMDPLSANFETIIRTFGEPAAQPQLRRQITNVAFSPDGKHVVTAGRASGYNPVWSDFDSWFAETDNDGKLLRPDEDDNANPYYVDLVDTIAGCFTSNTDGGCGGTTGFLTCAEVGGCKNHNVVSQFTHDINGTTPDPKFDYIKSQLDTLNPEWMTELYSAQSID